jgi:hypothetical protein
MAGSSQAQTQQHTAHPRSSTRLSTFSITPTLAPSIAPSHLSTTPSLTPSEKASPLAQDMHATFATLARLEEPRLANQRYVVSEDKRDEIGALALGAKLEKALARRMSGQDASFKGGKKLVKKGVLKKREEGEKAKAAKTVEASAA